LKTINSILIIDDEEDICKLLVNLLTKKISNVAYALNLKDAKAKRAIIKPDLILLDNNLPDGVGINYLEEIKTSGDEVSVIMITATANLKEKAMQTGADGFLEKPISFSALNNALNNLVS